MLPIFPVYRIPEVPKNAVKYNILPHSEKSKDFSNVEYFHFQIRGKFYRPHCHQRQRAVVCG
nr:MAG TPA: hypothetical protein [Caudoviricetes sp.]